jgi:hypothetical protein
MVGDDQLIRRRLLVLLVMVVVLIVCVVVYGSRSSDFVVSSIPSYSPSVTNPQILQNWLPPSVYRYVLARIDNYLKVNSTMSTSITVEGAVGINSNDEYTFTIYLTPQGVTHQVAVTVTNSFGLISSGVTIDGQQQGYLMPSQSSGTQFSGLDNLTSDGVTALQIQELQSAFEKFASTASDISILPSSIVQPVVDPNNPTLTNTYKFSVNIDDKKYSAQFNCIGLTEAELFLVDPSANKQVFDSGIMDQD